MSRIATPFLQHASLTPPVQLFHDEFLLSAHRPGTPNSPAAQQNSEATATAAGGGAQRSAKEQSARRKDEAKQAAKKPKENALSQFDLNNYASK